MSNFKVGSHDTGWLDASNPIKADKNALASGLSVDQAIAKAKQTEGAEIVVVKSDGKASVHALSVEDSFWDEGKKVLISELDRDPAKKQDLGKTPLAIDDNIANAFSGQGAFLVDAKNQTTYLGDDVDQTNAGTKLKDADAFLSNPTREKVDAAYAIARDAGNERHVDKTVARNALDQLQRNYRQSDGPAQDVALLKPGEARSKVEGLIGELKTVAGQESQRVAELRTQLSERTDKWQADLKDPTQKLNSAVNAWNQANERETQAVSKGWYNLREARMPNVHQLENSLEQAKGHASRSRQQLDGAIQGRINAEGRVNDLERLPREADGHLEQASRLKSENRGMHMQIKTYVGLTLSQVESERRGVERSLQRSEGDLSDERNKPNRPTGGGGSHTTDPFAGGGSISKPNHTTDPFAGGGSKPNHTTDPFAGGNNSSPPPGGWRDEGRVNDLDRQVSRLRRDRDELRSRENSLESVNSRLMFTQDIDQLSMMFYNLDPIDRVALNAYKERHDGNKRAISQQERAASDKRSRYNNEIGSARNNLAHATVNEDSARSAFTQAEGRVGNLSGQLQDLNANARPDSHAAVKPAATTYQKAVEHKEATVGGDAPLTVTRDKARAKVDGINREYQGDKQDLESNIANVQQSLHSEAQQKISTVRNQVAR
ncbi:MAG: hypothetical protein CVV27_13760 [Candidatus Melainabacteria bacterium HGW-Melainabacteria-1]|nr:MAG: hypothetical protein CVV27_13760 [Candidatus Melainabacteria bacterium HGW-Melainabacteria-1]